MTNEQFETHEQTEMEGLRYPDEVTASYETPAVIEEAGFLATHLKSLLALAGTAAVTFTAGFFTGKFTEKRKRTAILEGLQKDLRLAHAAEENRAYNSFELDGETYITADYRMTSTRALKDYIMQKILTDENVKDKEREAWREAHLSLYRLTLIAADNGTDKTIIVDEQI